MGVFEEIHTIALDALVDNTIEWRIVREQALHQIKGIAERMMLGGYLDIETERMMLGGYLDVADEDTLQLSDIKVVKK